MSTTHRTQAAALLGPNASTIVQRNIAALARPALDALDLTLEQQFIVTRVLQDVQYSAMTIGYRLGAGHTVNPARRTN